MICRSKTTVSDNGSNSVPALCSYLIISVLDALHRKVCKKELTRIIAFYNDERPHMSIGNQTPSVAHTQVGPQQKMWKNPWENSSN